MGGEGVLTVLYVEDHPSNVRLVERLLARRDDVRLEVAGTGEQGLAGAARLRPHLVLLDLHLPDLPGEVVLQRLWRLPGLAATPVVVLTADALPETTARLLRAGVSGVLTKPLDVRLLYRCLDAAVADRDRRGRAS